VHLAPVAKPADVAELRSALHRGQTPFTFTSALSSRSRTIATTRPATTPLATSTKWRSLAILVFLAIGWSACAELAIATAPSKQANPVQSELAKAANLRLWDALHGGHHERLPEVLEALQAAPASPAIRTPRERW